MSQTDVKGLAELTAFMHRLPDKIQVNIVRGALRAAAAVVRDRARENIRKRDGDVEKGIKVGSRVKGGRVMAYVRAKDYRSIFLEYGTKPHMIYAKKPGAMVLGGKLVTQVEHPGARPHPFMRPAWDATKDAALAAIVERLRQRITKAGIEIPDEVPEGEE